MRHLITALSLATISAPAEAQELSPDLRARLFAAAADVQLDADVVRVPMRGSDWAGHSKCPYFRVTVNGAGPFTFLYDTGAAYLTISSKVAASAHASMVFDRHGRRDVVRLDRLSLGGVVVSGVLAIVDDNWGVDGVIGFPTLGRANVLVDFSRREILVGRKPTAMAGSFTLPYQSPFNVPTVPVGIGGRTVPILIDTGDDAYALEIRSNELGNAAIVHPLVSAGVVMNGATKQQTATTTLRDAVTLGPMRALNAEIAINDDLPIGDFGYGALKQFRFEIRPSTGTVAFQPLTRSKLYYLRLSGSKTRRPR